MDNSSINFHDKVFLHFFQKFGKNEEKPCHGNLHMSFHKVLTDPKVRQVNSAQVKITKKLMPHNKMHDEKKYCIYSVNVERENSSLTKHK